MTKKIIVGFYLLSSIFVFANEATSARNVSPTIEIRYDDFLEDMTPSNSIGMLFNIDDQRYTGFDVNSADNETRILIGWNWTLLGIGTKEYKDFINLDGDNVESQIESIFSFGVKYSILEGMNAGVEYVMVDDPRTSGRDDYLRLSIGIKF
tara:strand:- start:220 stop:672 length:453 start_codon:yes stop_codon:yes gene_type:complete